MIQNRGKGREAPSEERDLPVFPRHQPLFSSLLLEKREKERERLERIPEIIAPSPALFLLQFLSYYQRTATKASEFFLSPWLNGLIPKGFYKPKQSASYALRQPPPPRPRPTQTFRRKITSHKNRQIKQHSPRGPIEGELKQYVNLAELFQWQRLQLICRHTIGSGNTIHRPGCEPESKTSLKAPVTMSARLCRKPNRPCEMVLS